MSEFLIKYVKDCDEASLHDIGFDNSYAKIAVNKYNYKNIKIFDLTLPQVNILKQTAISVGADCATHRSVITAEIDKSDCILGGSISQLRKICDKLKLQPFSLKKLAEQIEDNISFEFSPLNLKGKIFDYSKPYIVGVLNLTTDSFSDGGMYANVENAKKHLLEMINDGADIIDIGAESTKPFSNSVSPEMQLDKLIPILEFIKSSDIKIPISIDTRSSLVAEECLKLGADIINDVSGFDYDSEIISVVAKYNSPIIIQHSKDTPDKMQNNTTYNNLIDDIYKSLNSKIKKAVDIGIKSENIIVDVGIGFGKTQEQNFELLNKIEEFYSLKCPVMVGLSRKSLLGMQNSTNEEKDIYSLALNSSLIDKKVNFLRVHNVKMTNNLIDLKLLNYNKNCSFSG